MNLPHTWNAVDGNGSYYRGKCWYAKTFETPVQSLKGGLVFVEILAASSEATIYVNGTEVIYHEGGYSCSREIIKQYKPFLDEIDLTYTQYIAMMVLWEHKTMNVKAMGRFCSWTPAH